MLPGRAEAVLEVLAGTVQRAEHALWGGTIGVFINARVGFRRGGVREGLGICYRYSLVAAYVRTSAALY